MGYSFYMPQMMALFLSIIAGAYPLHASRADNEHLKSFHGSDFIFANMSWHAENSPFHARTTTSNPVVAHAPVFLFARSNPHYTPCYPEGASNAKGTGPNPGAAPPISINPGEACTNPGPYSGDYTKGRPFPVYFSTRQCTDDEWRIDYAVYYVHDGNLSAGHRHDWEGVTVTYRRNPNKSDDDSWVVDGVVFRQHSKKVYLPWHKVLTVDGEADVKTHKPANKAHPKIFVGFYSHASYPDKCDIKCGDLVNTGPLGHEYRSSDWWRIPSRADLQLYYTIPKAWTKTWSDLNHPWKIQNMMCGF